MTKENRHGLHREGRPYDETGQRWDFSGNGHAKCSCGELSPVLPSNRARQRWHKTHKAQIAQEAADADHPS